MVTDRDFEDSLRLADLILLTPISKSLMIHVSAIKVGIFSKILLVPIAMSASKIRVTKTRYATIQMVLLFVNVKSSFEIILQKDKLGTFGVNFRVNTGWVYL